jgi:molybdopterin synthase sulfur carrier subunit
MVRLRYFASLREALGVSDEQVDLPAEINSVQQLTGWLQARGPRWQQALDNPRLLTALNQSVVDGNTTIHDGDEIAWFPPVTGG